MTTHRMTADTLSFGFYWEMLGNHSRQLMDDITVHSVVGRPRLDSSINVESSTTAKIPVIILTGNARVARRRVRCNKHQSILGGKLLRPRLCHEVLFSRG